MKELSSSIRDLTKEVAALSERLDQVLAELRRDKRTKEKPIHWEEQWKETYPWMVYEILHALGEQKGSVGTREVSRLINLERRERGWKEKTSQASVSRSISELVRQGMVIREQVGRRTLYSLSPETLVIETHAKSLPEAIQDVKVQLGEQGITEIRHFKMDVRVREGLLPDGYNPTELRRVFEGLKLVGSGTIGSPESSDRVDGVQITLYVIEQGGQRPQEP